ncbi:hypothetical protein BGZ73_007610, partial [Actinomortierella ambigua]
MSSKDHEDERSKRFRFHRSEEIQLLRIVLEKVPCPYKILSRDGTILHAWNNIAADFNARCAREGGQVPMSRSCRSRCKKMMADHVELKKADPHRTKPLSHDELIKYKLLDVLIDIIEGRVPQEQGPIAAAEAAAAMAASATASSSSSSPTNASHGSSGYHSIPPQILSSPGSASSTVSPSTVTQPQPVTSNASSSSTTTTATIPAPAPGPASGHTNGDANVPAVIPGPPGSSSMVLHPTSGHQSLATATRRTSGSLLTPAIPTTSSASLGTSASPD